MDVAIPSPPLQSPLFGRDRELSVLRAAYAEAITGRGSLVLISGEAGVGKTALADALIHEASDTGAQILVGHCYDRTETPPYGPWIESIARFRATDPDATSQSLALPSPTVAPNQEAFFAQTGAFFAALAGERPLVLVFEDFHWADVASFDLLRVLARKLTSLQFLIVVTYRDDELNRHHPFAALVPLLVREAPVVRINLRPLDAEAAHALVNARYHLPKGETARLVAYLIARTEGNALFVTELLRTLEEELSLHQEHGRWQAKALERAPVPLLLKQVIDNRLTRLGDEADALLAVAAVIGHEVSFAVWQAVTQVDEETLVVLVERAEAAHLVTTRTSGEGLRFTHALIHDVLYEGVPALQRRRLHRQVAEVLAALPLTDPDAVASHFAQARDPRAATWLVKAGEHAEGAFAYHTAADRYEAAFALLDAHVGEIPERGWLHLRAAFLRRYEDLGATAAHIRQAMAVAREEGDPRLAANAQLVHSYALVLQGKLGAAVSEARAGATALEAIVPASETQRAPETLFAAFLHAGSPVVWMALSGRLIEARAEGERFLADMPAPPTTREDASRTAVVWAALAYVYTLQGELPRAWAANDLARAADAIVDRYRLFAPPIREGFAREMLACVMDDLAAREGLVAEAEQIVRRGTGTELPDERADYARYTRLPLLVVEGRWQEARALADDLIATYKTGAVTAPCNHALGMIACGQGEWERAWQLVHETLPGGAVMEPGEMNISFVLPMQRLAITLALDTGDLPTAREWLDAHDHWLRWSGAVLGQASGQVLWARYFGMVGMTAKADAAAQAALADATAPRQPLVRLAAHRLLGERATDAHDVDTAQNHFDAALALADACRAPFERALTLLAHAELAATSGNSATAITALDAVRAICTPLDARPTLARTDALLARLTAAPPTPSALPGGLSVREAEVLRLVATGLTNAQVADRLFLSPRTVNGHLTTIYAKLGVPSRAAAVRFALDHGLR